MSFKKVSSIEIFGVFSGEKISNKGGWKRVSSSSTSSHYMDSSNSINLEERLDVVADIYRISRDPRNYLLIPARANSIGRFNANLDGWTYPEIVGFRPEFGCRTYSTYNNKPHFVEHNASKFEIARGFILDSHLNLDNDADDRIKEEVHQAIGVIPDKDAFVEVIVAVDQTKDPILANAYKTGAIKTFSMGADVESTVCNICGNVATSTWEFCNHIRNKYSGQHYKMEDGSCRIAGELCRGTVFQELSVVSDPADKSAVIQDSLLSIFSKQSIKKIDNKLTNKEVQEIISFTARFAKDFPESLARIINKVFEQGIE